MCVCALHYMGGRFANVRVYWTGYGREKGPWRFLTCGEDLWTRPTFCVSLCISRNCMCVCVSVYTHIHTRARAMLFYTLTHIRVYRKCGCGFLHGGESVRVRLVVKALRRVSACVYRPRFSGSPAFPFSFFFFLPIQYHGGRVRNAFKTTQTPPSSPQPIESSSAPLLVHRTHIQTHLAFPLFLLQPRIHVYNIVFFSHPRWTNSIRSSRYDFPYGRFTHRQFVRN